MSGSIKHACVSLVLILVIGSAASARAGGDAKGATYAADLPSASGCGRRILLELFADDTYLFVQRYLCRSWSPSQMETGTWRGDGESVVLTSAERETRFSRIERELRYVGDRYGTAGLRLEQLN